MTSSRLRNHFHMAKAAVESVASNSRVVNSCCTQLEILKCLGKQESNFTYSVKSQKVHAG